MDTKAKGIILKLTDFKEADKLASIFTLEQGVLTANFRGVRKEKSKMKSFALPFTFAEFNFNQTGASRTVTAVNVIDGFYGLTQDYNKTIFGYIVLDIIKTILPNEKPELDLFVLTLNALKQIEISDEFFSLAEFIVKFIDFCGMTVNFDCDKYIYFDKMNGDFVPKQNFNTVQIDKKVYDYLKSVNNHSTNLEFSQTTKKQALRLLNLILSLKFSVEIHSFEFIV